MPATALKTWRAAVALSLTAWLLIASKNTSTRGRTRGGEGEEEGRGEQGGEKGPASERNAFVSSKMEIKSCTSRITVISSGEGFHHDRRQLNENFNF